MVDDFASLRAELAAKDTIIGELDSALFLALRAEIADESPGTPLGRLNAIAVAAVERGLCSGVEAKAAEVFLIEAFDALRAAVRQDAEEIARLRFPLEEVVLWFSGGGGQPFNSKHWLAEARAALVCIPTGMPSGVQQFEENARLTEVLSRTADVLGEARSGCIAGSGPDEAWDKQRDSVLADIRAALAYTSRRSET